MYDVRSLYLERPGICWLIGYQVNSEVKILPRVAANVTWWHIANATGWRHVGVNAEPNLNLACESILMGAGRGHDIKKWLCQCSRSLCVVPVFNCCFHYGPWRPVEFKQWPCHRVRGSKSPDFWQFCTNLLDLLCSWKISWFLVVFLDYLIICCDCINCTANIQQNAEKLHVWGRHFTKYFKGTISNSNSPFRPTENVILDPQKLPVYSNLGCLLVHQTLAKSLLISVYPLQEISWFLCFLSWSLCRVDC